MSLSDLAALGSFISGFAVLVSLVFLYFQLRQIGAQVKQAEKNQQAAIRQGRSNRAVEIQLECTDAGVAEAVSKGLRADEDMTTTQLDQFNWWMRAACYHMDDSYYQHEDGLLSDLAFQSFEASVRSWVSLPGWRVGWRRNRSRYGKGLVEWIDRLAANTSLAKQENVQAAWTAEFAAEKALAPH